MVKQYESRTACRNGESISHYESTQLLLADSYVELEEIFRWQRTCTWMQSSTRENDDWFGSARTFTEALELLRYGWPDGAPTLQACIDSVLPSVTQLTEQENYTYNPVEGIAVDMGRYTSGQPDCWLAIEPMPVAVRGNRVLRLAYDIGAQCVVSPESIINYGACIAAAITALEAQGYRTELWAVWPTVSRGGTTVTGYRVKRAEDELSVSQLAFVTGHPSMLRRIMFGMMERTKMAFWHKGGYGVSGTMEKLPRWVTDVMPVDVFLPSVSRYHGWQFSRDDAERIAIETLVKFQ